MSTTSASIGIDASGSTESIVSSSSAAAPTTTASTVAAVMETVKTIITSSSSTTSPTSPTTSTPGAADFAPTSSASINSESTSTTSHMLNVADLSASLQHFGIVDYIVFILMLVVCAIIGFYFGFVENRKKKKGFNEQRRGSEALDYLVGGRKMKVFPVSLSLVASFVSGISLLGTSTEIYVYGTQYAFILVTLAISGVISWYVFLPVFCNLQLTSTYEYFERRFDRRVRLFGSSLFIILAFLWMPISIYVPALTFSQVTGINIHVITPAVCVVCTLYTCIGGIKGVIWTDVLQAFIMVGALAIVIVKGTIEVGGLGVVLQRNMDSGRIVLPELTTDPTARMSMLSVFVGGAIFKLQGTSISQPAVQRFLSLPNLKAVKKALFVFTAGLIFLLGLCIYLGLLAYAAYYDCDPITTKLAHAKDQIVPLYVMQTTGMYPGISGLFVAGVFSAALSSLSTALNSLSGVILKDYIEPFRTSPLSERQTAIILRLVVVVFGLSSMAMVHIVEHLGMVMQLSGTIGSMTSGPLLGIFTVGMLLPFVNTKSVLTGCTVATSIIGYIAVRAQFAIASGELTFPVKPVSTEGCTYEFAAPQAHLNSTLNDAPAADKAFVLHHISFLWYATIGAVLTIVVSVLVTPFFGQNDVSEVDPMLIVPFVRRFLKPSRYSSVANMDQPAEKEQALQEKSYIFTEYNTVKFENGVDEKSAL